MHYFSLQLFFAVLIAVTLAACGGEETAPDTTAPEAITEAPAAEATAADAETGELSGTVEDGVRTITITPVGNEMKYEETAITVEAGETVRIVFENTATSPAMSHNVVFVNSADDINRVGQAAMQAAGQDYVPEDPAIFAYTPLAAPGETVDVTFTAPEEPGRYPYICTFPGHYMMMQGRMTVVPASNA